MFSLIKQVSDPSCPHKHLLTSPPARPERDRRRLPRQLQVDQLPRPPLRETPELLLHAQARLHEEQVLRCVRQSDCDGVSPSPGSPFSVSERAITTNTKAGNAGGREIQIKTKTQTTISSAKARRARAGTGRRLLLVGSRQGRARRAGARFPSRRRGLPRARSRKLLAERRRCTHRDP